MPRGDRTGPWGFGSRTGRGLGYCAGYPTPGFTKGPGMGWGSSYGRGRGWRGGGWGRGYGWGFYPPDVTPPWPATLSPADESKYLEQTLTSLKKEIEIIEKRLEELASEKKD
ncbi:MAG: DUF5320 domain-containing protein [Candidatus Hodarchaeota archaeon]